MKTYGRIIDDDSLFSGFDDEKQRRYRKFAADYKEHISNIGFRYHFDVELCEGTIYKVVDGEKTVVLECGEYKESEMWWKAWLILDREYEYGGIWDDQRSIDLFKDKY